jgi:hypothetical protein
MAQIGLVERGEERRGSRNGFEGTENAIVEHLLISAGIELSKIFCT